MDPSFANENKISHNNETIEICMNALMEKRFEKNPIVQIETSKNKENEIEKINEDEPLKLHA
jgi:hypothetical protein